MNVLFLGGFAASQVEWIAPVIESDVETSVVTDDHDPTRVAVAIGEADIIVSEAWRAGMPTAPRLKLLQLPVAGTDRVETAALPPGVTVCNAYGHEMAMAEYVVRRCWCGRIAISTSRSASATDRGATAAS